MKISVLGSGNGGCAVAFDCAKAGHDVFLFDFMEYGSNIEAINRNGGIFAEGELEGFQPVSYAGHDLKSVLDGAEVVFVVGPAYSTEPFGRACRPFAVKQTFVVCPSSCGGSIVFKNALGLDMADDRITIAETSTLPYAVRLMEPGRIRVFLKLKGGLLMAAMPRRETHAVLEKISPVYPALRAASSVLQTTLQNANPVIHPSVSLLNAALIERTSGDFFFYEEGVTSAVGRLIKAVDDERIAIGARLGFEIIPDPVLGMQQGYMLEPAYDTGYSKAPGFKGIRAQSSLDYRYFNEDVGYGLVFMSELGRQIGVDTPVMDSVIRLVSVLMNKDYRGERPRSMERMGLGGYSIEQIRELL